MSKRKNFLFSARDSRLDKQESSKLRIISRQLYQSISIDRRQCCSQLFREGQVGPSRLEWLHPITNNKQTTDEG